MRFADPLQWSQCSKEAASVWSEAVTGHRSRALWRYNYGLGVTRPIPKQENIFPPDVRAAPARLSTSCRQLC